MVNCVKGLLENAYCIMIFFKWFMTIECIEINWFCKHRKKVRSRQAFISTNSCIELSKTQFSLWVLLKQEIDIRQPIINNHQLIELCVSECYFLWDNVIWNLLYSGQTGLSKIVVLPESSRTLKNKLLN